jgi:hypothetical protein
MRLIRPLQIHSLRIQVEVRRLASVVVDTQIHVEVASGRRTSSLPMTISLIIKGEEREAA